MSARAQRLAHAMKSKSLQIGHRSHTQYILEGILQGSLAYCTGFAKIRNVERDIGLCQNIFFGEPNNLTMNLVGFVGAGDRVIFG